MEPQGGSASNKHREPGDMQRSSKPLPDRDRNSTSSDAQVVQMSPAGTQFTVSLCPREELWAPSQVSWAMRGGLPVTCPASWVKGMWPVTCHFQQLPHVLGQPGSAHAHGSTSSKCLRHVPDPGLGHEGAGVWLRVPLPSYGSSQTLGIGACYLHPIRSVCHQP